MDRYINGVDRLAQLQRQFLVHSFLYYHLNESIWEDSRYDECCEELQKYLREFPGEGPYYDLCKDLDYSDSGFYIKRSDYPSEIITTALRLLYMEKETEEGFNEFIERYGFKLEQSGQVSDSTAASIFLPMGSNNA